MKPISLKIRAPTSLLKSHTTDLLIRNQNIILGSCRFDEIELEWI